MTRWSFGSDPCRRQPYEDSGLQARCTLQIVPFLSVFATNSLDSLPIASGYRNLRLGLVGATRLNTAFCKSGMLSTALMYCNVCKFGTNQHVSAISVNAADYLTHCSAALIVALPHRALLNSYFPANIRSSCLRLRASTTAEFGCWMVNCSLEGSGFSILAGARVRQAACFAVPGCLGYCCAFYRYYHLRNVWKRKVQVASQALVPGCSPLTATCLVMQQR